MASSTVAAIQNVNGSDVISRAFLETIVAQQIANNPNAVARLAWLDRPEFSCVKDFLYDPENYPPSNERALWVLEALLSFYTAQVGPYAHEPTTINKVMGRYSLRASGNTGDIIVPAEAVAGAAMDALNGLRPYLPEVSLDIGIAPLLAGKFTQGISKYARLQANGT